NSAVREALADAGTTLVSALLLAEPCTAYVASVGDSRAYLIDDGEMSQVTRDHSPAWSSYEEEYVRTWLRSGEGTRAVGELQGGRLQEMSSWKREFLANHPKAHVIWNVVGYYNKIEYVDIFRIGLSRGDRLLLATDGLTDMVDDYEIWEIARKMRPGEAARELLRLANDRGGDDNVTLAIVSVDDRPGTGSVGNDA
ncbi:MAG: protein phosphatase 2C domain-containing protein, partial [Conexivisphaera sp.]